MRWFSPFAITGFVVLVNVNAVKRRPRRALTHIGEEGFKVVPTLADLDSLFAVPLPACVGRINAARFHRFPRLIDGGWARAVSVPSRAGVPPHSKFRTPLALGRVFACQRRSAHGDFAAAVATHMPVPIVQDVVGKSENSQPSKAAASEIDGSGHGYQTSMIIISREGSFHG